MIRFALRCDNDHQFESWFQSGSAYEALASRDLVQCPDCGSTQVSKSLMAPKLRGDQNEEQSQVPMTNAPDAELVEAVKKLREHVETHSEYVGSSFAREARAMHEGEVPDRPIYGEVGKDEAKRLLEDGVPALPLPFIPRQKTN